MPFAAANGIQMYYELHGKGEPLLLISGFTCDHFIWSELVEPLSAHYQVVLFDNRGVGQTEAPHEAYTIELMAQDTLALMQALELPRAYLVGTSMGGAIAQQMCLSAAARVKRAVIVNSFAKLSEKMLYALEWGAKLGMQGVDRALIIEGMMPWLYSDPYLHDRERVKKTIELIVSHPYPQPLSGYLGQIHALQQFDLRKKLPQITTPLTLVCGDEDFGLPIRLAEEMKAALPQADLHVFPGQAHMIHEEKKEELISLILTL